MKTFFFLLVFITFTSINIFCQSKFKNGELKYSILNNMADNKSEIKCTSIFNNFVTISSHDSLINNNNKFGRTAIIIPKNMIFQFKDFKNKQIVSTQNASLVLKDSLNIIKWKIEKRTKKIGNLICKMATGKIYGRNYEVWYCPDIPISSGPWKFYGLPGLILEASELNGEHKFQFTSLKLNVESSSKIELPVIDKKVKIVNKKEFLKIVGIQIKNQNKPIISSSKDGETIIKSKTGNGLEIWD